MGAWTIYAVYFIQMTVKKNVKKKENHCEINGPERTFQPQKQIIYITKTIKKD